MLTDTACSVQLAANALYGFTGAQASPLQVGGATLSLDVCAACMFLAAHLQWCSFPINMWQSNINLCSLCMTAMRRSPGPAPSHRSCGFLTMAQATLEYGTAYSQSALAVVMMKMTRRLELAVVSC